jgi:hypothetical protein
VHVALDVWTSFNTVSFLGLVAVFLAPGAPDAKDVEVPGVPFSWGRVKRTVKNQPIKMITLDFIKLLKGHTSKYLAEQLLACLKKYRLALKVNLPWLHIMGCSQ